MTPDPNRVAALEALDRALADPERLARVLAQAADPDHGAQRVADEFGLTPEQGRVVCDNALHHLTRARRAAIAAELAELRLPWGPLLELAADVRDGVVTVDVDGRRLTARTGRRPDSWVEELGPLVRDEFARPARRPVVVTAPGGVRIVAVPDGRIWYDRPD